jgi:hypothetical protein
MPETGAGSTRIDAREEPRVDIEDALREIEGLTSLAQWVELARHLCERMSEIAAFDSALQKVVKLHKVAINDAKWHERSSQGLSTLLGIINDRTAQITAAIVPELLKGRLAQQQ